MTRRLPGVLSVIDLPNDTNRRRIRAALRFLEHAIRFELTDRQREILLLYYRDDLTMQQIAERLHLTRGTVCKHIHKAVARLQRAAKYAGFTDPTLRS